MAAVILRAARGWGVSQAEVVRRAVKEAADRVEEHAGSVAERLQRYRAERRLPGPDVERYLEQTRTDRPDWFGAE